MRRVGLALCLALASCGEPDPPPSSRVQLNAAEAANVVDPLTLYEAQPSREPSSYATPR